ncbi:MAG: AAA family ATPase [Nitrososphaerota archaeon]|jgi:AAA15 family ATPase/GTPase|nr:AAA family ATPase [Nitrososphaerota archaeon]MDG6930214.1 AAA family ATPase [Nitrososphaerota archaeon]MDG6931445.1 AAA family ATPase [Nitrososphaerota archaeon]MDG6936640.1 AAA family ATPase [Nitrososphaerota archaeon]MDG6944554.1 AAA family ATPase [Nitrososphaerota archaeon]
MKIVSIKAKNFLTFEDLDIKFGEDELEEKKSNEKQDKPDEKQDKPNEELYFIVGPNGSGKTNIIRLVEFVSRALNYSIGVDEYGKYSRNGDDFSLCLELKLHDGEKNLLADYFWLAVITQIDSTIANNQQSLQTILQRNLKLLTPEAFDILKIEINSDNITKRINVKYWLSIIGDEYEVSNNSIMLSSEDGIPTHNPSLAQLIFDYLNSGEFQQDIGIKKIVELRENRNHVKTMVLGINTVVDISFVENIEMSVNQIINKIPKNVVQVDIRDVVETSKQIYDFLWSPQSPSNMGLVSILSRLFITSMMILKNPRAPLADTISLQQGGTPSNTSLLSQFDGERAIKVLYGLYNSSNSNNYKIYNDIFEKFNSLTKRQYNVRFINDVKQPQARLSFIDTTRKKIYSSDFLAAGDLELIMLLTVIIGNTEKTIFLDEPAANLHPTMQTQILGIIKEHSENNQFIIITHSPYMIDYKHDKKIIRFVIKNDNTQIFTVNYSDFENFKNNPTLCNNLINSLFAKQVIVGEGPHEVAALNIWLNRMNFDMTDRLLIEGNGTGNLPSLAEILNKWGIEYITFNDRKNSDTLANINSITYNHDDIAGLLESQPKFNEAAKICHYEHGGNHIYLEDVKCLAENIDPPKEVGELVEKLNANDIKNAL